MPLHDDVGESGESKNCGQRVKPHAEGPGQFRPADAKHDYPNRLKNELQKNANNHQRRDYVGQREKAKQYAGASQRE